MPSSSKSSPDALAAEVRALYRTAAAELRAVRRRVAAVHRRIAIPESEYGPMVEGDAPFTAIAYLRAESAVFADLIGQPVDEAAASLERAAAATDESLRAEWLADRDEVAR